MIFRWRKSITKNSYEFYEDSIKCATIGTAPDLCAPCWEFVHTALAAEGKKRGYTDDCVNRVYEYLVKLEY